MARRYHPRPNMHSVAKGEGMLKRGRPRVFRDHLRGDGFRRSAALPATLLFLVACAGNTGAPPAGSGHSFGIDVQDTWWEGHVSGFVEIPPVSVDAPRCVALLGEIRPMAMPGVVSSGLRVPRIGLAAAQIQLDEAAPGGCDVGYLDEAGYGPIRDARVTVGTTYPFYRVFRLPSGIATPRRPLVGSVADPLDSAGRVVESFEPLHLTSLPSPDLLPPVPITEQHTMRPAGSGFAYPDGATPWEGTIFGLVDTRRVPVPPLFTTRASARSGRCVLILGWLWPGATPVEGNPAKPRFGLIADGRLLGSGGKLERCDTTAAAFAGFRRNTEGPTTVIADGYPFYEQIFIPETIRGAPEAITVRYPWSENQWFLFEPSVLPHPPDPPAGTSDAARPVLLLPAGDPAISTFTSGFSFSRTQPPDTATSIAIVEWEGLVRGLTTIPTTAELGYTHRCLAVVGTLAVSRFEGFDLTTPPLRPDVGLMIDGRHVNPSPPQSCDTSRLQKLGYVWLEAAGNPAGSNDGFYQTFALTDRQAGSIQAVTVGSPWFSDVRFYEPTILAAIPAG